MSRHIHTDWAAIAFVYHPNSDNTVLVKDEKYKSSLWKLPGGKYKTRDSGPEDTVLRELKEETGLIGVQTELRAQEDRNNHIMYLFQVTVLDYDNMLDIGDEGEIVSQFPRKTVTDGMVDFFPGHMNLLRAAGIITTPSYS